MCHNGAFRGHAERTSDGEVLVVDQPLDDLSARGCGGVKDDSGRLLAARRGQCGAEQLEAAEQGVELIVKLPAPPPAVAGPSSSIETSE